MSETPLKEFGFDRLKVQNTQSYTLTEKMMQIIHPNQIINTYTLSFVHVICPQNQSLFILRGGKTVIYSPLL